MKRKRRPTRNGDEKTTCMCCDGEALFCVNEVGLKRLKENTVNVKLYPSLNNAIVADAYVALSLDFHHLHFFLFCIDSLPIHTYIHTQKHVATTILSRTS